MPSGEVLVILLLILLNGFFALSEMALVSAKRSRLQAVAEQGRSGAKSALALLEDPTTFLSAIQIGITLIGMLTGVYSGATLADWLAQVARWPRCGESLHRRRFRFGIVVVIVTFVSLIIGELVPKRVALTHAESLAMFVAPIMRVFARAMAPGVWLLRDRRESRAQDSAGLIGSAGSSHRR